MLSTARIDEWRLRDHCFTADRPDEKSGGFDPWLEQPGQCRSFSEFNTDQEGDKECQVTIAIRKNQVVVRCTGDADQTGES